MSKTTLVLGTSLKPNRYSNLAVRKLRAKNFEVKAFGLKGGTIGDVTIDTERIAYPDIHTITLYLNPNVQKGYYDYILSLNPERVIFNPGTENMELVSLLKDNGIHSEIACTLVLLSIDQY